MPPNVLRKKNKATDLFKNGQFGDAAESYTDALELLEESGQADKYPEAQGILYNNRSAEMQRPCCFARAALPVVSSAPASPSVCSTTLKRAAPCCCTNEQSRGCGKHLVNG